MRELYLKPGRLGIEFGPSSIVANGSPCGLMVKKIEDPSEHYGLMNGSIILKIDGRRVDNIPFAKAATFLKISSTRILTVDDTHLQISPSTVRKGSRASKNFCSVNSINHESRLNNIEHAFTKISKKILKRNNIKIDYVLDSSLLNHGPATLQKEVLRLKRGDKSKDGLVLLMSGQLYKKKQLLLEANERTETLKQSIQEYEGKLESLEEEVKELKSDARTSKGQIRLLKYQLEQNKPLSRNPALMDKTQTTPRKLEKNGNERNVQQSPALYRGAWLFHWKKSEGYRSEINTMFESVLNVSCTSVQLREEEKADLKGSEVHIRENSRSSDAEGNFKKNPSTPNKSPQEISKIHEKSNTSPELIKSLFNGLSNNLDFQKNWKENEELNYSPISASLYSKIGFSTGGSFNPINLSEESKKNQMEKELNDLVENNSPQNLIQSLNKLLSNDSKHETSKTFSTELNKGSPHKEMIKTHKNTRRCLSVDAAKRFHNRIDYRMLPVTPLFDRASSPLKSTKLKLTPSKDLIDVSNENIGKNRKPLGEICNNGGLNKNKLGSNHSPYKKFLGKVLDNSGERNQKQNQLNQRKVIQSAPERYNKSKSLYNDLMGFDRFSAENEFNKENIEEDSFRWKLDELRLQNQRTKEDLQDFKDKMKNIDFPNANMNTLTWDKLI